MVAELPHADGVQSECAYAGPDRIFTDDQEEEPIRKVRAEFLDEAR
jgi:hypothetical protein